jgi:phosphotransferase system enzyme I (PtsP)
MQQRLKKSLPSDEHSVFHLYLQLLESPTWISDIEEAIDRGFWAPSALRDAVQKRMAVFEDMNDTYLQERSNDIADLANRVLKKLLHCQDSQASYPNHTILVGYDISVSSLAEVPEEKLAGIVSVRGSPNSHVAILARAMGIPFITGAVGAVSVTHEGDPVIVNGYTGHYYVSPHPSLQSQYQALAKQEEALDNSLQALKDLPAETLDGHRVQMLVNTGFVTDIQPSLEVGAEGVGLYRTEVPFLIRDRFPSEEEQYRLYRQLLESFHPKMVTVRTLDVGGDKPLPYFSVTESNPSLGWRGLRMTLDHPEILMVQLRALFRASDGLNNTQIMLPMVSQVSEVKEAIGFIQQAYDEILEEGADIRFPNIGAMVEVPGVVCLIPHLAQYLDFFSVGSNDLTQYLLAVDRNNAQVASLYDILHPSVVHTLYTIVKAAHAAGKPVGLCGEMAADPAAVLLLLGMGFDSLSVHATRLPRVKWVIRNMTYQKAQALVQQALQQEDATAIRQLLHQTIEEAGLEGLMYVGKPI